jgi:hypothetical protein
VSEDPSDPASPNAPAQRHAVDGEPLCESCARPDDDLAPVHRMYVVPAAWDTVGSEKVLDEVEIWCFSCRSLYPHQPVL